MLWGKCTVRERPIMSFPLFQTSDNIRTSLFKGRCHFSHLPFCNPAGRFVKIHLEDHINHPMWIYLCVFYYLNVSFCNKMTYIWDLKLKRKYAFVNQGTDCANSPPTLNCILKFHYASFPCNFCHLWSHCWLFIWLMVDGDIP